MNKIKQHLLDALAAVCIVAAMAFAGVASWAMGDE